MKVLLLLPLSRYYAEYHVGLGRPFSEVDRLVLAAIGAEGSVKLDDLQTTFRMPRRLLLEVLVTLLEEGWLSFDREGRFALTRHGEDANDGRERARTLRINKQHAHVWLEGYCGMLMAGRIPWVSQAELQREQYDGERMWDLAYLLKVRYGQNELDRGLVRPLLREPKDGWIQRITLIEPRVLGGNLYLPVGVDLEERAVTGLPEKWRKRLGPELLEAAEHAPAKYRGAGIPASYFPADAGKPAAESPTGFENDLPPEAILVTADDHQLALEQVLRNAAFGDSILIASGVLDICRLRQLTTLISNALNMGVHIDLLWGSATDSPTDSTDADTSIRTVFAEVRDAGYSGRLRWNPAPTLMNARMVLWVSEDREKCRACVSSYEWLGPVPDTSQTYLGFRLENPGLLAELCQHGAAMLGRSANNELSGGPDRWRQMASDLENLYFRRRMNPVDEACAFPVVVRVIRDRDHVEIIQGLSSRAEPVKVFGASFAAKPWAHSYLAKLSDKDLIITGMERPAGTLTMNCQFVTAGGCRANCVLSGDDALTTSWDPVSLRAPGGDDCVDLGVLLKGAGLAQRCADRIGDGLAEAHGSQDYRRAEQEGHLG